MLNNRTRQFGLFVLVLSACYALPLFRLVRYSIHDEFFSYIPLIPFISIYLVWLKKNDLPKPAGDAWPWSGLLAVGGLAVLAGGLWLVHSGWKPQKQDYLSFMIASYVIFVAAGCVGFFGRVVSHALFFPVIFLVFMIPMPSLLLDGIVMFFQQTSATTAAWMLTATGMPVFRDNVMLYMPGLPLLVAPECSGIHSTMVLLITSLLSGHLFLQSKWKRLVLALVVVPLAILRNGFRIFVLGELAVHVSHRVLDSPLHHRGGPIFFVLSLIPFFGLLYWLRKSEFHGSETIGGTVKVG